MKGFSMNMIVYSCFLLLILLLFVACASTPDAPEIVGSTGVADRSVEPSMSAGSGDVSDGNMIPPKLITRAEPDYPESMRKDGIQGRVVITAMIDREGNVKDPTVLESINEILDAEAINCIAKWKFEPGTVDGEPVDVEMTMSVEFKLN